VKPTESGKFYFLGDEKMTDEQMKNAINGTLQSLAAGDIDKSLLYFAVDVVYIDPFGTFKGIADLKRYFTAVSKTFKESKITDTGIGIMIQGNIGISEHVISATMRGMKGQVADVNIFEFKNDKIQTVRGYLDRLDIAKQAAKGPIEKMMVNMLVNSMEKGLKEKKTTKS
jgi:hypothetical protein